ncbi:hypothetical protein BD626DRAFT_513066 [Schizophyllum amplum]|uniref:Uncharacterized protein n=1 Tax=Schizophyllum amplum TaxID=97359 RepID=A0A550BZS8_9AGAR|nr:hypothetical protein BD626DRAFT_513066 [Auriculariopsis ampla]
MTTMNYDLKGILPVVDLVQQMDSDTYAVMLEFRRITVIISRAGYNEVVRAALQSAVSAVCDHVTDAASIHAELGRVFFALDRAIRFDDWRTSLLQMRPHYDSYMETLARIVAQSEAITEALLEFERQLFAYHSYPPVIHYATLNIWLPLAERWQMGESAWTADVLERARAMVRENAHLAKQALDLSPEAMSRFDIATLERIRELPDEEREAVSDVVFEIPEHLGQSEEDMLNEVKRVKDLVARIIQ